MRVKFNGTQSDLMALNPTKFDAVGLFNGSVGLIGHFSSSPTIQVWQ